MFLGHDCKKHGRSRRRSIIFDVNEGRRIRACEQPGMEDHIYAWLNRVHWIGHELVVGWGLQKICLSSIRSFVRCTLEPHCNPRTAGSALSNHRKNLTFNSYQNGSKQTRYSALTLPTHTWLFPLEKHSKQSPMAKCMYICLRDCVSTLYTTRNFYPYVSMEPHTKRKKIIPVTVYPITRIQQPLTGMFWVVSCTFCQK